MANTLYQELGPRNVQYAFVDRFAVRPRHAWIGKVDRQDFIFILHVGTQQRGPLSIDGQLHFADVARALMVESLTTRAQLLDVPPSIEYSERVTAIQDTRPVIRIGG